MKKIIEVKRIGNLVTIFFEKKIIYSGFLGKITIDEKINSLSDELDLPKKYILI